MLNRMIAIRASALGAVGAIGLLTVYVGVVTLVSGWNFFTFVWFENWYWVLALALGFGLQVGLYAYLKKMVAAFHTGKVVAASGTTSTAAMLACCAHYLVNFAPFLGLSGAIGLLSQYQQQFFLIGILFNLAGVTYLVYQFIRFNTYGPHAPHAHTSV